MSGHKKIKKNFIRNRIFVKNSPLKTHIGEFVFVLNHINLESKSD